MSQSFQKIVQTPPFLKSLKRSITFYQTYYKKGKLNATNTKSAGEMERESKTTEINKFAMPDQVQTRSVQNQLCLWVHSTKYLPRGRDNAVKDRVDPALYKHIL